MPSTIEIAELRVELERVLPLIKGNFQDHVAMFNGMVAATVALLNHAGEMQATQDALIGAAEKVCAHAGSLDPSHVPLDDLRTLQVAIQIAKEASCRA